jgi:thioredoxin-like negative regulator of GroEL
MKTACLIGVLASILCLHSVSAVDLENGVMVLTDKNFDADKELSKYEHLLVYFYIPQCGHCKELMPEYEGAA